MSSAEPSIFRRLFPAAGRGAPRHPIESLKTLAIVIPLTAMIWVYAENAQSSNENMTVRVQFVTSNEGTAATVPGASSEGQELQLSVDGPRGQIEQFKQTLREKTTDGKLALALPGSSEVGNKSVNIADAFKLDPAYWRINVKVKSNPSDLPVTVEPMSTVEVPIAPPEGLSVTLQNVSFNPPRVKVSGPQSAIRGEFGGESPRITVDASVLDTTTTTVSRTKPVSLVQPKNGRIKLGQSTVEMTYEVGSMIREGEIRGVYIDVRRPAADEGRYRVTIKEGPVKHNVLVTGPSNSVSTIIGDHPSQPVRGIIEVTKEDADKGPLQKEVHPDFSTIDPSIKAIGTYEVTVEVKSVTSSETDR